MNLRVSARWKRDRANGDREARWAVEESGTGNTDCEKSLSSANCSSAGGEVDVCDMFTTGGGIARRAPSSRAPSSRTAQPPPREHAQWRAVRAAKIGSAAGG